MKVLEAPLTTLDYYGEVVDADPKAYYVVNCRLCGDVTREESGGTVNFAPLMHATLYRQRHLAKHLERLAAEIKDACR